jgi:D-alanyl-lipoteichoic acid acyltransferase DltB (MBOAT superfamily)
LLFGGPLINYNSFIFQQNIHKESQHNVLFKMNKILYVIELLFIFGVMEIYNHFLFPIFLFKNKEDLIEPNSDISLFYYCFICLNILTFLWLKYAIIWKSFRLWAWYDGIFVEENMNRFVYDFYSIELLFRGLNRTLNRWMIRYIYIPLGGKNKKYVNIWVVFCFWYLIFDFKNIDYGIFAICCCLLMDLEMFIKNTFINKFGEDFNEKIFLRFGKYLICSFNVFIMFLIGLFGFHFSLESFKVIVDTVIENGGFFYFINFILFLLPSVVMMFFIRDMELENCALLHKKPLNY